MSCFMWQYDDLKILLEKPEMFNSYFIFFNDTKLNVKYISCYLQY
jgi:hypothetical protein